MHRARLAITLFSALIIPYLPVSADGAPQGVDYDSAGQWAESGPQPDGAWSYGLASGDWQTFVAFPDTGQGPTWIGGSGLHWGSVPAVGQFSMQPADDARAVRRWLSPVAGSIEIDYDVLRLGDAGESTAIIASIQQNGAVIWDQSLAPAAAMSAGRVTVGVSEGDVLDFSLDAQGSASPGWTHFGVQIRAKHLRPVAQGSTLFHWPMDGTDILPSGSGVSRVGQVADRSMNKHHGRMFMGVDSRIPGRISNCLNFNGGSDYVVVEPQNAGDGATALTFSVWISPVIQGGFRGIITSTGPTYCGLNSTGYVTNGVEFRTLNSNLQSPAEVIPFGAWTHVAGVWKSGVVKKLFINGEVVASETGNSGTVDIDDWMIGRDRTNNGRVFNGRIDDPAVWMRDLSDAEVKELYQLGLNGWDASYLGNVPTGNDTSYLEYTTGLTVWLDGQDIDGQGNATLLDGEPVETWTNKAGGTAGSGQASPSAVISGLFAQGVAPNRLDALRITADAEAGIRLNEFMKTPRFSVFAVARNTGGQGARPLFWDGGATAAAEVVFGTTAAGCWVSDAGGNRITRSFPQALFDRDWGTGLMILSGSTGSFTLEAGPAEAVQTAVNGSYASTTWESAALAPGVGIKNGDTSQRFDGEIAEILIYDHALDATQRAGVLEYLDHKYFQHKGGFLLKIR